MSKEQNSEEKKDTTPQTPALKMLKPLKPHSKRESIDFRSAVRLMLEGYRDAHISRIIGCSKQAVQAALAPLRERMISPSLAKAYNENMVNFLTAARVELLAHLTSPEKLEKASLNNVAYAFAQVDKALRLETGQSTSIFSVVEYAERDNELDALDKEIEAIEAEYEYVQDGKDTAKTED